MKVLVINTPLFEEANQSYEEDSLPPIGLGYIATSLQLNNINVEFIDAIHEKLSIQELISRIEQAKPNFLALNIFTTNFTLVKEIVETLRNRVHIVIGGSATKSLFHDIILWNTTNQIDVVVGDGEKVIVDILKNRVQDEVIKDRNNLNRRVIKIDQNSMYYLKDISNIPLNRHFFKNEPRKNIYNKLEANLITSRGCIYNCTFCAAARSQNREIKVRERTPLSITAEIKNIISDNPEVSSIRILDDLFLKSRISIQNAIRFFSGLNLEWRSMAHIRTFTNIQQNILVQLRESGCRELFIGIESGSPKILKSINKTSDVILIKRNLVKLFKAQINVKGYFIYGFPDEIKNDADLTYTLALEIMELAKKYDTNFRTSVFQFRPYHGTEIYNQLRKKYPNLQLTQNKKLSRLIGREQFNFHANNYSKISLESIHDYICKTNKIQWKVQKQLKNPQQIQQK